MSIGKRIKTLRKESGLTLAELSKLAKVSKAYLSQLENEHFSNPSSQVLLKICAALDVSIETLLGSGSIRSEKMREQHASPQLRTLAKEEHLNDADLDMLSRIYYDGKQPTSMDGWRAILNAIRQSINAK